MRKKYLAASAAIVLLCLGGMASAVSWSGVVSSDWHDPGNWTGGVVPAAGQAVDIVAGAPHKLVITDAINTSTTRFGIFYIRDTFTINAGGSLYVGQMQFVAGTTVIKGLLDSAPGGSTPSWWRPGTFTIDGGTLRVDRRIEIGDTNSGTITINIINGGVLQQMGGEYLITGNYSGAITNVNITGLGSRIIQYDNGTAYRTLINRYNSAGRVTITNGGSWLMSETMTKIGDTWITANGWVRTTVASEELALTQVGNLVNVVAQPRTKAGNPSPANGTTGLTYSPTLSWTPGVGALRSEVYFGTSQTDVAAAQRLKADINADGKVDLADVNDLVAQWLGAPVLPCPDLNYDAVVNFVDFAMMAADYNNVSTPLFLGSTTGSTFDPNELLPNSTYYWRVDSADCNGVVPGTVWSFATASSKAATPSPANNSVGVTGNIIALSWAKGFAGSTNQVYFGTSAGSLTLLGTTASNTMNSPSGIQQNTQYYWRVDVGTPGGTITGDVWTFKTGVNAFPTAEGFGAVVTGGRYGTVYHVTNLNDSGTGSFRDAVSASNRIVVFDVGGVIAITSPITVSNNITIAGQTAPGGIVVYGNELSLSSHNNIIVRYLSVRQGINGGSGDKAFNMTTSYNIMVDHVSVTWGRWDTIGISDNAHDITMQNCIMGESIAPQNFGGFIDSSRRLTLARSLFLDNNSRNPKGKGDLQYINNVIYNWGGNGYCGGHSSAPWYQDLINNYFIAGPSSSTGNILAQFTANDVVYNSGNYTDLDKADTNGDGQPEGRLIVASDFKGNNSGDAPTFMPSAYNVPPVAVPLMSAANALPSVLSCVGNSLNRDGVDQRLINQVKSLGTLGAIIDTEVTVGGQTAIVSGTKPTDTDNDGMPDFWETAMGLSVTTPDNNGDADGDGYTNIEQYLNWLAGPHAQVTMGGYVDVDLQPFTSGFTSTATYTITDATNGTAVILGDGHTARFTSTGSTTGLGSFSYTVDDGRSMTGTVQVLVQ